MHSVYIKYIQIYMVDIIDNEKDSIMLYFIFWKSGHLIFFIINLFTNNTLKYFTNLIHYSISG